MPYKQSENIDQLSAALAAAQRMMEGAAKDSANPFYRSKYADLASVWSAVREPLGANGLSVVQMPSAEGSKVTITTVISHASGQWFSSDLTMTAKRQIKDGGGWEELDTPQSIGSTITYARRYALAAIAGVAPEDDDGEAAQGRAPQQQYQKSQTQAQALPPEPTMRQKIDDACLLISQEFSKIGEPKRFLEVLGSIGYTSPEEIPTTGNTASEAIKLLKLALADAKQAKRAAK